MSWQPIEAMPDSAGYVLLSDGKKVIPADATYYEREGDEVGWGLAYDLTAWNHDGHDTVPKGWATHWMPLPEPPDA